MTPAHEQLYARLRAADFPALVAAGTVHSGPFAWWSWLDCAPPGELAAVGRQLEDVEARLAEQATRLSEGAQQQDADRLQPSALDDRLEEIVSETPADMPARTEANLAADYEGSEEQRRDREAAEALASHEDEE